MGAGYYISKNRCAIVVCLWIAITVMVGLLAGLIKKPCPNKDGDEINDNDNIILPTIPEMPPPSVLPPQGHGPWMNPFLPNYTLPVQYDLWFNPDFYFNGTTFQGRENITINFIKSSTYIIVHYKMMSISKTRVFSGNGDQLEVIQTFAYDPNQYWVTEVKDEIAQGSTIVLQLEFDGSLTNGIVGYYKSTYINQDTGQESWLATTKFQPTDSRKAFPNFDEPKYKANFTVTLHHWRNFTALSNMPNMSINNIDDEWRETMFYTTPKMSSYLLCFIVCDFVYEENTLTNGKPSRVWTSTDKISQVRYALQLTKRVVDYFEKEFDMEYHLPKLDQVAVPDYPSGATEHWGLITYREARLLFDDKEAGVASRQGVAEIVAHELAHNYVGNVVTCEWWNDIWLNEGFASYYGDMSLVDIETEFEMDDHFIVTTTQSIMQSDAEGISRAIIANVTSPNDINQAFTSVVYSKGAALLRMFEAFMGKVKFRDAIRKYLKSHEYSTVVTSDLFKALQEEEGNAYDMSELFEPWLRQMGFPVINIKQNGSMLIAEQKRFLYDPDVSLEYPTSPYGYKWYVPLTYQTPGSNVTTIWLNMSSATFPDPRTGNEWLKFNYKQKGYYRVNYPKEMWKEISNQLKYNYQVFDPIDRANILDDAFNLARATQLEFPIALDMTAYMSNETHYFPWSSAAVSLSYISHMLMNDGEYSLWRKYIETITASSMEALQVEDSGGYLDRFYLSPNLRRFVYEYGMLQAGDEEIWDKVWQRFTVSSGVEKYNLAYCLSWTNKLWLTQKYLDYAMDPTKIKSQDFFTVIRYISTNPNSKRYLWDWIRANYQKLIDRFGLSDRYFGRMVPSMVAGYNTEFQLQEVQEFYAKWKEPGAGLAPRIASISSIESNIAWMKKNRDPIINWLRDNVQLT